MNMGASICMALFYAVFLFYYYVLLALYKKGLTVSWLIAIVSFPIGAIPMWLLKSGRVEESSVNLSIMLVGTILFSHAMVVFRNVRYSS